MVESVLILEVPEAQPLVESLRAPLQGAAASGMPAHITLLYPFLPSAAIDDAMLDRLRALCGLVECFSFQLCHFGRFDDRVLYLAPTPAEPFVGLATKLRLAFPSDPTNCEASREYVAHLTIARRSSPELLDQLERAAVSSLPLTCTATRVTVMTRQPVEDGWTRAYEFALAQPTSSD